ncbi:hypothetical protein [Inquilinus sp. CAU 1745]|uniref:hypothetical protein n=1 Tax=Inquilinus sp. CAU 1745 TaxID=3140369 RepID=UPI00325B8852
MQAVVSFVRTTLVGGVLFLVPVVLAALILREAAQFAMRILRPFTRLAPSDTVAGIAIIELLAIAALIALCFLAGLIAGTKAGHAVGHRLEYAVLRRIPGFMFLRTVMASMVGLETNSGLSVALASIEDAWVLSFVIERHPNGLATVFVPSAPTPAAGYLPEDRIRPLDVPVSAAMACITRLGVGSIDLLEKAGLAHEIQPAGPAPDSDEQGIRTSESPLDR